jgi:hypothetical protein
VPRALARGPNRGRKTWRDGKEKKTIVVSEDRMNELVLEYEKETGFCEKCRGTGEQYVGWSRVEGNRYSRCRKCLGTGSAAREGE